MGFLVKEINDPKKTYFLDEKRNLVYTDLKKWKELIHDGTWNEGGYTIYIAKRNGKFIFLEYLKWEGSYILREYKEVIALVERFEEDRDHINRKIRAYNLLEIEVPEYLLD